MKYIDKLLNYFTSNYLNNTRFHHSTLGYLKIFFERNNKLKSTFNSLGNVFRNSKWSDLKVQNIKTSLIKSWTGYFTGLILILMLFTSFLGSYYGNALCAYFPFLGEIYETLSFLWSSFEDLTKALIISIYSLVSNLKSQIAAKFYKKQEYIYSVFSTPAKEKPQYVLPYLNIVLSETAAKNHAPIEMLYRMAHTTQTLGDLKSSPTLPLDTDLYHYDSWNINECLDDDFFPFSWEDKPLLNLLETESAYVLLPKEVLEIHQLDIESANLNKINAYNTALALTGLNTQSALKSSKESRWLFRNSLLSENSILNSNAFTQSKKLLGVNFLSSDSPSKNVWASTKLNTLGSSNTSNFISNIQELFVRDSSSTDALTQKAQHNNDMSNFNFFEDSRMWLTKKYFFTNQLKNNTKALKLSNTYTLNSSTSLENSNTLNLLVNMQSQNPTIQLSTITLTFNPGKLQNNLLLSNASINTHLSLNDTDLFKANTLSFVNKLTSSTSTTNLNYFSPLKNSNVPLKHVSKFQQS